MNTSSEDFLAENNSDRQRPVAMPRALWPRLVELWISAVLAVFFLLRVLGSHTAQRVLSGFRHPHLP
jgi:hypothetical protein